MPQASKVPSGKADRSSIARWSAVLLLAVLTAILIGSIRLTPLLLPGHETGPLWTTSVAAPADSLAEEHRPPEATGRNWRFPLMDDDGYYFLRLSENLLRTGSPCEDAGLSGCRDKRGNAPIGRDIDRAWSPHVVAVAATHHVLVRWQEDIPMWVSAAIMGWLLGVLLIVPLILMLPASTGWPAIGALVAVIALTAPAVALRTMAADNDIWMAVLPMMTVLVLAAGLARSSMRNVVAVGVVAGLILVVLSLVWAGWILFPVVIAVGVVAVGAIEALYQRRMSAIVPSLVAVGVMLLVVALSALLPGVPGLPFREILTFGRGALFGLLGVTAPPADVPLWPSAFDHVLELQRTTPEIIAYFFGTIAVGLGLSGPIVAALPSGGRWSFRWALVPFTGLMLAYFPPSSVVALGLGVALLLVIAVVAGAVVGREAPHPLWTLTTVWLVAILILTDFGTRYLFLLGAPMALGIGAALLTAVADIRRHVTTFNPHGAAAGLSLVLAASLVPGYVTIMRTYPLPNMNEAWHHVLTDVGDTQATVVTWWDWGHRTAYFARRPVVTDGASLQNSVVHWVGHALVNANSERAAALMHMTACGAAESEDGPLRPFEFLHGLGMDPGEATTLIQRLVTETPATAQSELERAGLGPEAASRAAAAITCRHPEVVLLTTTLLLHSMGWIDSGMWHPATGSGVGVELWSAEWHPCSLNEAGEMSCTLGLLSPDDWVLTTLRYDPEQAFSQIIEAIDTRTGRTIGLRPQVVRIADADGLTDGALHGAVVDGLAVLVDTVHERVFLGTVASVRSLLFRLVLLEGRYDHEHFERLSQATSLDGEQVTAWRVLPPHPSTPSEDRRPAADREQ